MSQINTNANNGFGNTNWNQISVRVGQAQGSSCGKDRSGCSNNHRNNSITTYLFEGKMKDC